MEVDIHVETMKHAQHKMQLQLTHLHLSDIFAFTMQVTLP